MKKHLRFRHTTLLMFLVLGFLGGLGLARMGTSVEPLYVAIAGITAFSLLRPRNLFTLVALVIFGFSVGIVRGHVAFNKIGKYESLYNQKVIIRGKALSDSTYGKYSQIEFDMGALELQAEQGSMPLTGKILVSGFGEPMVYRGDRMEVSGKLRTMRGGRQGIVSYADISTLSSPSPWYETARLRFSSGLTSALPEPTASFGLGLLIGQKTSIPDNVSDQLSKVGLTHLVAVSGYNLTILIQAARRMFGKRSKFQSTVLSVGLIGLFLLFSGLSASIVRAAIVSLLSLWAWYYGRTIRPTLLILLAAAITAGYFPPYLWSDIGWWLSFLAFYGVIVVAPLLSRRLFKKKEPHVLASVVIESVAAQIVTIPLIAFVFGDVSIISLVANILVVPLVPLAMLLTLIAGLGGVFLPFISGWFALPARLLLTYMLDIVTIFSRVPNARVHIPFATSTMLYAYGVLLTITGIWWRKYGQKYGKITDARSQI